MNTAEKFKMWLETIYISEKTQKNLKTGTQYVTGLNALNKLFNLPGEGIYDINTNLNHIRNLINKPENFQKDYSSHFNAFVKFREYYIDRENNNEKPLKRQIDVFKKQQTEISAIESTIKYFESLDYIVMSKEKDNVGWDLEATNIYETLLLEVKGLSGNISSIELTPNEYKNSKERSTYYKLCIVTNALTKPKLEIFSFNSEKNIWTNALNESLQIEERTGARMWKE
ncbi:protein NO VEIN domain-containing protein [Chryseobacterium aquaticum]|uniref:protein NO VEIN domain-containing protein n=1 Tax=Chryseobacterium aquaticum TaxID=452084 RepID=UPI002FC664F8